MNRPRKTAKGKVNKLIDEFMHPYSRDCPALILLDGLLHTLVEQDPEVSLRKFVKYGVPMLIESIKRRRKRTDSKIRISSS